MTSIELSITPPGSPDPIGLSWSPISHNLSLSSPLPPIRQPQDFVHPNFMPRQPADLVIKTSESSILFAHRAVLGFASPSFWDMVEFSDPGSLLSISLDGSSRGVRALLEWIYPHMSMRITGFDTLDDALAISTRYQLRAMHNSLQDLLNQPGSGVHIREDPIRAYSIACKHGLSFEARKAARLAIGKLDFRKPEALIEMRTSGVDAGHALQLVQRQFAWESELADILLRASCEGSETEMTEEESRALICSECVARAIGAENITRPTGMIGWQRTWAERIYGRLICTPFDECDYMFYPDYATRIWDQGCGYCMVRLMRNQALADEWMRRVWRALDQKWVKVFESV